MERNKTEKNYAKCSKKNSLIQISFIPVRVDPHDEFTNSAHLLQLSSTPAVCLCVGQ